MQNLEYSKYTNSDNNIIDEDNTLIEGIANFCAVNRINNNSRKATELNKAQDDAIKCKKDQKKTAGEAHDINKLNKVKVVNTNTGVGISAMPSYGVSPPSTIQTGGDRDANGKLINTEYKNSGAKPRYNNMKNTYDQTFTTTINLGIGIIVALFFITKYR
jgi:hypothetical protein